MIGVNTVAVPIFRNDNELAGALAIVGSIRNVPNPPRREQVELLQACAGELSQQLNSDIYERLRIRMEAHAQIRALK
jgi:DNA-binding IclR family transcriptional regulator